MKMMKPRTGRVLAEQASGANRTKVDQVATVQANNSQTSAQAIRKRRSSINVYDQPSSLNSRLRQLETDMLRLDEDRSKLYDDTHSALAQYELKLNEIHAILRSRQDNLDKYAEDMKMLLQAKESFEKQAKLLHEKHERVYEKFMHRETTISRDIKLLKNKFELLEKNRQFRTILNKSNTGNLAFGESNEFASASDYSADLEGFQSELNVDGGGSKSQPSQRGGQNCEPGFVGKLKLKVLNLNPFGRLLDPLLSKFQGARRKSNRISSVVAVGALDPFGAELAKETELLSDSRKETTVASQAS